MGMITALAEKILTEEVVVEQVADSREIPTIPDQMQMRMSQKLNACQFSMSQKLITARDPQSPMWPLQMSRAIANVRSPEFHLNSLRMEEILMLASSADHVV